MQNGRINYHKVEGIRMYIWNNIVDDQEMRVKPLQPLYTDFFQTPN